jgi:F-type H+-transporting ATPase subunit a
LHLLGSLVFPPIGHLVQWKGILFKGTIFEVNKTVLIMWASVAIVFGLFYAASRRASLVPTGVQNLAEAAVDFVQNGIILQTIGEEGLRFTPFLLTVFSFILVGNIFEIIPIVQFPANARMAFPLFGALMVWAIYNWLGIKEHGFIGYIKHATVPPGVPKAMLPLVVLIEVVSKFLLQPFSLAVRLFANELAGHLLLVTFAVLSTTLITANTAFLKPIFVLPAVMLVALTGFELLVAVLQAFIFTILTGVYIAAATSHEH